MGHKAHPIGLRLGIHRKWRINWYFESKNYTKFLQTNFYIENFIKGFLFFLKARKTLVLQTQLIKLPSNIMFMFIFYYRFRKKWKKTSLKKKKENIWRIFLENYFLKYNNKILTFNKIFNKQAKLQSLKNFILKNNKLNNNIFFLNKFLLLNKNILNFNKKTQYKNIFFKIMNILLKIQFLTKYNKNLKKIKIISYLKILSQKLIYLKKYLQFKKYLIKKINIKTILKKKYLNLLKLYKIYNFIKIYSFFYKKNLKFKLNLQQYFLLKQIVLTKTFWEKNLFFFQSLKKQILKKKIKFLNIIQKKNLYLKKNKFYFILNKKTRKLTFICYSLKNSLKKFKTLKNKKIILTHPIIKIKKFLSKITNIKFNLIFINALSFSKFFYLIQENKNLKKKERRSNILAIQRMMLNKYKYNAIFIKDFIFLAYITTLLKNPLPLVKFIAHQFKRLPKNRKQLKLLKFLNQSIYIFCKQRREILGFKFQITGRLNRRRRTHKWVFQKGILSLQTHESRVEYAYSEGFTRRGLIGIHLWIFYKKQFSILLKKKLIQYLFYSKYKKFLNYLNKDLKFLINPKNKTNKDFLKKNSKFYFKQKSIFFNVKTKSKKISKK